KLRVQDFRDHGATPGVALAQFIQLAGVARAKYDRAILPAPETVDLTMIEASDLAPLARGLIDLEEAAFHAGTDKNAAVLPQEPQEESFFAEDLANRSVRS